MKFTNTTSISEAMHSKISFEPVRNFWDAMLYKYDYEICLHLAYLFATNWLARITSRYLILFKSDLLAHDTQDFVKNCLTFQISSEIKYKILREIKK